jgi:3-isopropylmalate dehydratase small subunit
MKVIRGRAWVFGDDVNTDVMAPGLFFKVPMEEMAKHCLEAIDPRFASDVRPGDIIVAGRRFGVGSAREQAAMALRHLGVGAVLAVSFGRIFYRNALNFGLPALFFPAAGEIQAGDALEVEPVSGRIIDRATTREYRVNGVPEHLMDMVAAGGLMPYLKQRLATGKRSPR